MNEVNYEYLLQRRYEKLMSGETPVESHLHKHLAEHINSEIALNTINTVQAAIKWLHCTFLYVRVLVNPVVYGFTGNISHEFVERKLHEKCLTVIDELQTAGLILRHDERDSTSEFETTPVGKLMVKYSLYFETLKFFRQVRGNETFLELLCLLTRCKEFHDIILRVNEKCVLNRLNATPLRFPIPGRIKLPEQKILCLIQAVFGNIQITAAGLALEALKIMRIGDRLANSLLEYFDLMWTQPQPAQSQKLEAGSYRALLHVVTLVKCFHARLWENSEFASKQLRKVGFEYADQFVSAGKRTLQSIAETDARTIEAMLKKSNPFGDILLQNLLQTCPQYELQLNLTTSRQKLCIRLAQVNELYVTKDVKVVLIIGDSANNLLLYQPNVTDLLKEKCAHEISLHISHPEVEYISAHIVHTTLVGVDTSSKIVLNAIVASTANKIIPKRKRQMTLTTCAKKRKNNKVTKTAETGKQFLENIALSNDSFLISLQQFSFDKTKLSIEKNASTVPINQSSLSKRSESAINDIVHETRRTDLVQTKVTNFFEKRKSSDIGVGTENFNIVQTSQMLQEFPIAKNLKPMADGMDGENITLIEEIELSSDNEISQKSEKDVSEELSGGSILNNVISNFLNETIPSVATYFSNYTQSAGHNDNLSENNLTDKSMVGNVTTKNRTEEYLWEISSNQSTSENTQKFWYNVCLRFLRLPPPQRNFTNFQKVYKCCLSKKHTSCHLKAKSNSTFNETFQSHVCTLRGQQSNSFGARLRKEAPLIALEPTKSHSSSRRESHPFRLQIFPKSSSELKSVTENFSTNEIEVPPHPSVSQINRSVMRHVLSQKFEQQPLLPHRAVESNSSLVDIETQLLQMEREEITEEALNFDQLCRLYLSENTGNIILN